MERLVSEKVEFEEQVFYPGGHRTDQIFLNHRGRRVTKRFIVPNHGELRETQRNLKNLCAPP